MLVLLAMLTGKEVGRRGEDREDMEDKGHLDVGGCDEWGKVKGEGDEEGNDGNNRGEELGCEKRRCRGNINEPHSSELNLRS